MQVRFEPFQIDTVDGRLTKFGVPIPLREQALQVLLALVDRPGELVTRAELRSRLWSNCTTVDFEAGLNTAVSRLRDALNDEPDSPRFIETVPKRGYRFIARILKSVSVAVMPLQNATSDQEGEYIADGLSEDMISILARIEGVRIASRSSVMRFKGTPYDPKQVAQELGVAFLVEGSVRKIAERIQIHVHLVNGRDGFDLWSQRFDGGWQEILSIHDRVAEALASALERRLGQQAPHTRPANALAYAGYVKGHYLVARNSVTRALEYFKEAMELDPDYALPYHGAAVAHILRALMGTHPPAEELATAEGFLASGLKLAPQLCLMQNTLGMLRMFQWRWQEAESAYESAIAAEPGQAYAHMMFALYHSFRNRHTRALQHARKALALEPLDPMTNFRLLQSLYYAREFDAAIDAGQTALELAPGSPSAYCYLAWALLSRGRHEEAWHMASKGYELQPDSPLGMGIAGYVAGVTGRKKEADTIFDDLKKRRAQRYSPAIPIAWTCLGLGDIPSALHWLNQAFEEREPYLAAALVFPGYDPIRADPTFGALLARIEGTINS